MNQTVFTCGIKLHCRMSLAKKNKLLNRYINQNSTLIGQCNTFCLSGLLARTRIYAGKYDTHPRLGFEDVDTAACLTVAMIGRQVVSDPWPCYFPEPMRKHCSISHYCSYVPPAVRQRSACWRSAQLFISPSPRLSKCPQLDLLTWWSVCKHETMTNLRVNSHVNSPVAGTLE